MVTMTIPKTLNAFNDAIKRGDMDDFVSIFEKELNGNPEFTQSRLEGFSYIALGAKNFVAFDVLFKHYSGDKKAWFSKLFGVMKNQEDYFVLEHLLSKEEPLSREFMSIHLYDTFSEKRYTLLSYLINRFNYTDLTGDIFNRLSTYPKITGMPDPHKLSDIKAVLTSYTGSLLNKSKLNFILAAVPDLELSYHELSRLLPENQAILVFSEQDQQEIALLNRPSEVPHVN